MSIPLRLLRLRLAMTRFAPRNDERGVVLLLVMVVIVVISITLPAYVTWTVWEQKNLIRKQTADYAHLLAQAGLNRALVDLKLDENWVDGNINGNPVHDPEPGDPHDAFYALYTGTLTSPNGTYSVEIRFLYENEGSADPYSTLIWVRSTGTAASTGAKSTLEQLINKAPVKNIGTESNPKNFYYSRLQDAVDDDVNLADGDTIAITDATLNEDVTIDDHAFFIRGCYDFNFLNRDCLTYESIINGSLNVTETADVDIGGVTIN